MTPAYEDRDPELALIVGAARSGTTLQRALLDAHPEIGCPAEAGLPSLMSHMAQVWSVINIETLKDAAPVDPGQPATGGLDERRVDGDAKDGDERAPVPGPAPPITESAREWIRASALAAMRSYCLREHKRIYVDKSLDSVYHLELVRQVFPKVRCVLAVRHVMDTIASGIEASPWGFQAYGYSPYVQRFPGNTVAALGSYWLDHVTRALEWEKRHPDLCLRVRYEDLVTTPDEVVAGVQSFLGVVQHPEVLHTAFGRDMSLGPADYKIEHTTSVHAQSIGHGKRVPVSMLPPPLLAAISEKLEALGYEALDRSWNTAERSATAPGPTIWSEQLQNLMGGARLPVDATSEVGVFAVVAEDHHELRWIIDTEAGSITAGDGDVDAVLTGTTEDLILMLTGQENLGALLRSGRIRHLIAAEEQATPRDSHVQVKAMTSILRSCLHPDIENVHSPNRVTHAQEPAPAA